MGVQNPADPLLHHLYRECLDGKGGAMPLAMELALQASFGSVERWRNEFIALGNRLGADHAWSLLRW
jgi:superoxide dismutase, Fe-Mn family